MSTKFCYSALAAPLAASALLAISSAASAQYAERPALLSSGSNAVDASGRSVKNKRVRAIHEEDSSIAGGTAHLIRRDPFLAYQLGRNLNFREFRERDGVFNDTVANLAGLNPDGLSAKITADNQTSCLGCHNLPNGNPGGGANFSKDSGFGRNSPHYFGAGIMEMLAIQVRADMLGQVDRDGSGWIDANEAGSAPERLLVEAAPGAPPIDYGSPRLTGGRPSLNNIFRVWYVDADGRHVPGATAVGQDGAVGYNFNMIVWGWGQGSGLAALNPTNRVFLWDPYDAHSGLQAYDPSTTDDPDGDGVSLPTLAGAIQFPATHVPADTAGGGTAVHAMGYSLADPDGDGALNEISEGDLDLAEWFMLHAPRPAFAGTAEEFERGVEALESLGCVECHVANWKIREGDDTFAGDRRVFDLDVKWNGTAGRLEGSLVDLGTEVQGELLPERGAFVEAGLFTDLRHHDMGPGFAEVDFGGTVNTTWRTAPLWGVGSSFPWGHDGKSLTLEDAIVRHGGAAAASAQSWMQARPRVRQEALSFLRKLVLYDIESLPADIDGDGVISPSFQVAGKDTGTERFNAEWLFNTPVEIEGEVTIGGTTIRSFAAKNLDAAYGQLLPLRIDSDNDGWPDVWDADDTVAGYLDGVN